MIDKIVDPDIREEQAKYVNTPDIGAFTEEEAENMDERVVAIVKEAKNLRDLDPIYSQISSFVLFAANSSFFVGVSTP